MLAPKQHRRELQPGEPCQFLEGVFELDGTIVEAQERSYLINIGGAEVWRHRDRVFGIDRDEQLLLAARLRIMATEAEHRADGVEKRLASTIPLDVKGGA